MPAKAGIHDCPESQPDIDKQPLTHLRKSASSASKSSAIPSLGAKN
jgi:hypothetical protein